MTIKVRTAVTHSAYALQDLRDRSMGGFSQTLRDSAKRELDRRSAMRGIVTEVTDRSPLSPTYSVEWDDGSRSGCLDYMVTPA